MSDEIFLYTLIWVADNTHFLHFLKVPGVISTGLNIFWSQEQEVRSLLGLQAKRPEVPYLTLLINILIFNYDGFDRLP